MGISGISTGFPVLSQSSGQVAHVLLTRSPLGLPWCCHQLDLARLACVKHAASVRPEPGSNSPSRPQATHPKARNREIGEPGRGVTELLGPTGTERLWRLDRSRRVVRSVLETNAIARDRPHWRFQAVSVPFSRSAGQAGTRRRRWCLPVLVEGCGQNSHFLGTRTFNTACVPGIPSPRSPSGAISQRTTRTPSWQPDGS